MTSLIGKRFSKLVGIEDTLKRDFRGNHIWKFKCDCGKIVELPRNRVNRTIGTKSCGCSRVKDDLTGKKFGKLTVVSRENKIIGDGCLQYRCLCSCGKETVCSSTNLRNNKSRSCGCERYNHIRYKQKRDDVYPRFYFEEVKLRAKNRNMKFNITHKYIKELFLKQNKMCNLTGNPIVFAQTHHERRKGLNTASLDRIDSTKGYIKGNVQIVHKHINIMKLNLSLDDFKNFCIKVADYERNKRKSD